MLIRGGARSVTKAELSGLADSENNLGGSSESMYYIGLNVHKTTISYCVKDAAGRAGVKNLFARGLFLGISFHGLHRGMERFPVIRLEELSVAN